MPLLLFTKKWKANSACFFYSKKAFLFLAKKERQQFDNKIASSSIHKKMKGKILPVFLKQKGFSFFGKKRKGKTFLIVQQNCLFFYSQKKKKGKILPVFFKSKKTFLFFPIFFWQKGNNLTLPFLFVAKKERQNFAFSYRATKLPFLLFTKKERQNFASYATKLPFFTCENKKGKILPLFL